MMLRKFLDRFRRRPAFPAMIRVLDAMGRPLPRIRVEARYWPSGRLIEGLRVTAQGLCVFHWVPTEKRLQLLISHQGQQAQIEIDQARPIPAEVIEVRLS